MNNSNDLISRQAAIDVISLGKKILSRVLDDIDVVGTDREKYSWGLGLIESSINDIEELPSAHCDNCPYPSQYVPQEDAVSRKAVLKRLTDISYNHCKTEGEAEVIGLAKTMVVTMPSVQPEQTDCEYCYEDSDGYVRPIEKNSHAWLVRRGKTMKLRICFKGEYRECDILFCPMCGRRLKNG